MTSLMDNRRSAGIAIGVTVGVLLALNPRVATDGGRPIYAVSCSTGFSIHWAKLAYGNGLLGVYSLESAARTISGEGIESPISSFDLSVMAKAMLLKPCR